MKKISTSIFKIFRSHSNLLCKIISILLVIFISLNSINMLAMESSEIQNIGFYSTNKDTDIRQIYYNLPYEAKEQFIQILLDDQDLLSYHVKHVEPISSIMYVSHELKYNQLSASVGNEILHQLNQDLIRIGLPTTVRYALMAVASGMAITGLDGPLPVADIVGLILAVGGVTIISSNWNIIYPKWNQIVSAFKKAFRSSSFSISQAFETIRVKIYFSLNKNRTVQEILKTKKASIKKAPLPPRSPMWSEILTLTLKEIQRRAQRGDIGYSTIYKLLTDKRFDR